MWNNEVTYEIESENGTRITCTTLGALERLVEKTKRDFENTESDLEKIMLPFEFIIGSLFPNSYESIKDAMTQQYIEGYQAGLAENENEWETLK